MADKSTQLILDALNRAVHDPEGLPLHGSKAAPGMFPATALARQAAHRCKEEGLVRVVSSQRRGKQVLEICALTDKGLAFLLREANPRQVLEDFIRALEARQSQLADLVRSAQRAAGGVEALRAVTLKVLQQLLHKEPAPADKTSVNGNGAAPWPTAALQRLAQWQTANASEDCPLPELFRHLRQKYDALTVGQFHDGLRQLHQQDKVYLHPWTGPLYALPEPSCALLIGHEIVYYASLR
jgi:hypothetical protein